MFGYLAMQMPAGLSIYFIVSNLVGMGVQWATNRWLSNDDDEEPLPTRRQVAAEKQENETGSSSTKRTYKKRGYKRRD
jgi:membrane protein insertase Oxa1/YidC/SpoIIIJ